MLFFLFLLLKIIGIVLLSVLGLFILILLLVLFVPIRYQLKFERSGKEGEPPAIVHAKVTWLLHFLNICANYPSDVYVRARVFLFTVFRLPDRKKKTKKEKQKSSNRKKTKEENKSEKAEVKDQAKPDSMQPKDEVSTKTAGDGEETWHEAEEIKDGECKEEKRDIIEDNKKSIWGKWDDLWNSVQEKIDAVSEKIEHIEEKKDEIENQIDYYLKIFESKTFREAFSLCKKELLAILKSIGPRKVDIWLEVGMEDPATTASILSYYGIFYAVLYNKVHLIGNFEEAVIRGKGIIKGRITIARILLAGIRVYFNKHIKKLLRMLKKEERKNGRK